MNKVLIKVYVPMIEEKYEVWIPINKKVYNVIRLLSKAVNELSDGYFNPNDMPVLYNRLTAIPYDINLSVKENNIRNSEEIILI